MPIDLHAHTTASDGSFSPTGLVELARQSSLTAVGITDHDTIGGWDEAIAAGERLGVEVVPGVELSVSYEGGRFHLLGYYLDPASSIIQRLTQIQAARANRNGVILENLARLGVPLEEAEVRAIAGEDAQIGRPHFAQAMLARGYVASVQDAFDRFLKDGGPAYATKQVLTPKAAIQGIAQAGGVAIWAHPPRTGAYTYEQLEERLVDWVDWGLDGLEVEYSGYSSEDTRWALRMKEKYHLLAGGGSDFHGASKPHVRLGVTNSGGPVDDEVLKEIVARRDRRRDR